MQKNLGDIKNLRGVILFLRAHLYRFTPAKVVETNVNSTRLQLTTDTKDETTESWHVQPVFYTGGGNGYSGQPERGRITGNEI